MNEIKAVILWVNRFTNEYQVKISQGETVLHTIYRGGQPCGYCSIHDSWDCQLTPEENEAEDNASDQE